MVRLLGTTVGVPEGALSPIPRAALEDAKPRSAVAAFALRPFPGVAAHVVTAERGTASWECFDGCRAIGFVGIATAGFHLAAPGVGQPLGTGVKGCYFTFVIITPKSSLMQLFRGKWRNFDQSFIIFSSLLNDLPTIKCYNLGISGHSGYT